MTPSRYATVTTTALALFAEIAADVERIEGGADHVAAAVDEDDDRQLVASRRGLQMFR